VESVEGLGGKGSWGVWTSWLSFIDNYDRRFMAIGSGNAAPAGPGHQDIEKRGQAND